MKRFPREVLNEIKWRYKALKEVNIYYINRGSPHNIAMKSGKDIIRMDGFSITFAGTPYESYIPYHRILKITYDDKVVFRREDYDRKN